MSHKRYYRTAGIVFLLVAIAHLFRALYGWTVYVESFTIPVWFSWFAVILAGSLAYVGLFGRNS